VNADSQRGRASRRQCALGELALDGESRPGRGIRAREDREPAVAQELDDRSPALRDRPPRHGLEEFDQLHRRVLVAAR
jgi:hypothetical protein